MKVLFLSALSFALATGRGSKKGSGGSGLKGDFVNSELTITCDDFLAVWIDGVKHDDGNMNDWTKTSTFPLFATSSVVAVKCGDNGFGVRGILGSTSFGGVTNTADWKCSKVDQSGWQEKGFKEGPDWVNPSSYRNNVSPLLNGQGIPPWHFLPSISPSAFWIWLGSSDSTKPGPHIIYCRYNIPLNIGGGLNESADKGCAISKTCEMMNGTACFMPGMEKKGYTPVKNNEKFVYCDEALHC